MKKQLLFLYVIFAIFATSCSSFRIEKRHYKNGYYVNLNGGKNHGGASVAAVSQGAEKTADVPRAENLPIAKTEVVDFASASQPEVVSNQTQVEGSTISSTSPPASTISTEPAVADKVIRSEKNRSATESTDAEPTAGDDTETILLVVLAIFLSPLAVYLKEGASKRFWIDLICWLIGGGFFLTPFFYGGGLWLFAVVFALLIVLDII